MWQRIQTVFLAITIVALIISLVQPVWTAQTDASTIVLTPFYLLKDDTHTYMPFALAAMFAVASITVAIIELRRFDNRLLQMKLGAFNTLLLAGLMIATVWFCNDLGKQYPVFKYGPGLYLIFAAVICNWIALRFIRRDERLVRESDRIR